MRRGLVAASFLESNGSDGRPMCDIGRGNMDSLKAMPGAACTGRSRRRPSATDRIHAWTFHREGANGASPSCIPGARIQGPVHRGYMKNSVWPSQGQGNRRGWGVVVCSGFWTEGKSGPHQCSA